MVINLVGVSLMILYKGLVTFIKQKTTKLSQAYGWTIYSNKVENNKLHLLK